MSHLIAPSMLSCDFTNLASEIEMINESQADWFHLDVMDGRFVPNITFGMPIIKQMKILTHKPLDVHLMIMEPDNYIPRFAEAGADYISVHIEACSHLHRTIQLIKDNNAKAAVALNPHSPISLLDDIITDLDMVLIMSVNPGFGGQKFIENTYTKLNLLKELIIRKSSNALIEVDGGVSLSNAKQISAAGADVLVAGNAVFKSENPLETIRQLKNL